MTAQKTTNQELEQKIEGLQFRLRELENSAESVQQLRKQQEALQTANEGLRKAEEALRKSEDRLRLAYQAARIGTFEWNIRTGVNIWSPELESIYGLSPGGFNGTQPAWENLVYPQDRAGAGAAVQRTFETGKPAEGEWRVVWPDGSIHWLFGRFQLFKDDAGNPLRLTGINIDITARKQAEEALRESEHRFRTMANAIPQLAWIAKADGYIYWYNQRWYEYTGTTPEQMEGWGWQSVHDPQELPKVLEQWRVSIATGAPFNMIFPLRGADGDFRPFLTRVMPLKDEQGHVQNWFGTNTDVTEQKRTEEALRESEARLQALYASMTEGLALHEIIPDATGQACDYRILEANPAFESITGISREQAVGSLASVLYGTGTAPYLDIYSKVAITSIPIQFETTFDPMSKCFHIAVFSPARGRFATVFQDITDRKQAERQLKDLNDSLEKRVQERTAEAEQRTLQLRQLAADLTLSEQRERKRLALVLHDGLQQTLVAAKFQLALVERGRNVEQATADVFNLIDDCIETSRSLTAELSPPILHRGELIPALEWLAQWMRDKHGLSVELASQGQIAAAPEEITVLLFQSVRELLFNVAKHAGTRKARIGVLQLGGCIQVQVADEGVGFDPDRLRDPGSHNSSGTGLFSIRERLDYIGGTMEIDAAPGQGARFTLLAPSTRASGKIPESSKESRTSVAFTTRPETDQNDATKIRVVLVDDHLVMRQGLASLLSVEPDMLVVGEASDGKSAIDLVRNTRPAIVLMDIGMPGMDGVEATRRIHEQMPEVKIIGLSMFQEGEQAAAILAAGAVAYLAKTGPSEAVTEAIRNCARSLGSTAEH